MKRTLLGTSTLILGSLLMGNAIASNESTKIVYGEDNRIETFQASKLHQRLASATAGMINNNKVVKIGDQMMLPPYSLKHDMNLCAEERFAEQPSAVVCSGFLVGKDLLVTAGHCIQTQKDCDEVSWVFDYKVKEANQKTDILIPAANVFRCKKVIDAKLESTKDKKVDYALVQLERVATGRAPLKFRKSGKVSMGTELIVIGHPSGLPQKVAGGATVLENSAANFFQTNLDTFGGNSGSAVFDAKTGVVEGILVRGAKDYEKHPTKNCNRVHKTTHEITDFSKYGESVSRITDIKALQNVKKFMRNNK
jgi:V8-like Glu-specific endopeptidase